MNHDSMIEVIAAHRDGKEVELRFHVDGKWESGVPLWNFAACDYRIKPEPPPKPREFWFRKCPSFHGIIVFNDADTAQQTACASCEIIKVVEVLPSTGEGGGNTASLPPPNRNIILAWLGRWRSEMPVDAVSAIQDILGVPESKPL